MFFLATVDADGRPQCSYKGGAPGFVRVLDDRTIAYPSYDGNGMFLSAGNIGVNPEVGLLFIDLERGTRLRFNGIASIDVDDPLIDSYPGCQLVVRVRRSSGVRQLSPVRASLRAGRALPVRAIGLGRRSGAGLEARPVVRGHPAATTIPPAIPTARPHRRSRSSDRPLDRSTPESR